MVWSTFLKELEDQQIDPNFDNFINPCEMG